VDEIDFDQVLATLQGMLGERVIVAIENPNVGGYPLNVVGVLEADDGMTEPFDEEQFDFAIGDTGGLTLHRLQFVGASTVEGGVHVVSGSSGNILITRIELMSPIYD